MKISKRSAHIALQITIMMTFVIPVLAMLSGCTLIIDSANVNTEVIPTVSAVELAL